MELTIHTNATAPEASRSLLDGIHHDLGVVPNLAASIAASPALLAGFDGLRRAVAGTDPLRREVAGLATGVAVDNRYGVAFHSMMLGRLGLPDADVEAMRTGNAPADATLAAVHDFARAVALHRGAVDDACRERLRLAGLGTAEILDLVAECAFAMLVGLIDTLAGRVPLDEFLAPHAWKAG